MNIRKGIFIILYFISAVLTYYLYEGSITIAGFGFMYSYLAPLPFVALAFACFLVTPNIDRMINVGRLMGIFAVPLILTVIYSLVLWIVNFAEFRTMTRGLFFCCLSDDRDCHGRSCCIFFWKTGGLFSVCGSYYCLFNGYCAFDSARRDYRIF